MTILLCAGVPKRRPNSRRCWCSSPTAITSHAAVGVLHQQQSILTPLLVFFTNSNQFSRRCWCSSPTATSHSLHRYETSAWPLLSAHTAGPTEIQGTKNSALGTNMATLAQPSAIPWFNGVPDNKTTSKFAAGEPKQVKMARRTLKLS
jgi:hypothetical protein